MECRKLELTVVSAQNLPDVRALGSMKVYAKVSLKESATLTSKRSAVDYQGETNPTWNFVVDFTISESSVLRPEVNVVVKLTCDRTLGDRFVGEVRIPVKNLFDMGMESKNVLSYSVAGTPYGRLNLSYRFSETTERMAMGRPSGWKTAVGLMVVVGGAMLLLGGGEEVDGDPKPSQSEGGSRDVYYEVHDGDVFYDTRS